MRFEIPHRGPDAAGGAAPTAREGAGGSQAPTPASRRAIDRLHEIRAAIDRHAEGSTIGWRSRRFGRDSVRTVSHRLWKYQPELVRTPRKMRGAGTEEVQSDTLLTIVYQAACAAARSFCGPEGHESTTSPGLTSGLMMIGVPLRASCQPTILRIYSSSCERAGRV